MTAVDDDRALAAAIAQWRRHSAPDEVIDATAERERLGRNTLEVPRGTPLVLRPSSAQRVPGLLAIAARYGIPLHPIATGRNWGYGCAAPVRDGTVILDLSRLRAITVVDERLGLVRVEPGVTQQDLSDHLVGRGLEFLVPVNGAGPDASILGNALERGYGLTPTADHFAAVTAMSVALADGSTYRSPLGAAGADLADACFKWGVGPYLDGIFSQSGFGVVLEVTVALAPRPERVLPFLFSVERDEDLEAVVDLVRSVLTDLGTTIGGLNLINRRRMLAMVEPYPFDRVPAGGVIPDEVVEDLSRRHGLGAWTGVGTLYGPPEMVTAARRRIRRLLGGRVRRLRFLHPRTVALVSWLGRLPGLRGRFAATAARLRATVANLSGRPSEVALPLAYWRRRAGVPSGRLDPSRDGSGLIWYSPLVPMRGERVRGYVDLCERLCRDHGMEPAITLTSCSDRCFDSTVPLVFERDDAEARYRARACYDALIESGRAIGLLPYRYGIDAMDRIVDPDAPCWRVGAAIKSALDPRHVLAPGRYCLASERCRPLTLGDAADGPARGEGGSEIADLRDRVATGASP